MKKSVRIRKANPGETPGYYNKTKKFLNKAQMGAEVGSPSNDPARINQIYENVYISLKNDVTPDLVYDDLISNYAVDQNTALSIIQSVVDRLTEEGYMDPSILEDKTQSQEEEVPQNQEEELYDQQRAADDEEMDQLAMSDEGYYNEEDAFRNQNSYLDTEQEQQQQAFRFGGYKQDGGESNYDPASLAINQYASAGNINMEKPFSMEDLMAITPGMQNQASFPGLEAYIGNFDYVPMADTYQPQNYLPQAQLGKTVSNLSKYVPEYDITRQITPMTNMSLGRKYFPIATLAGAGVRKLPLVGSKLNPKLASTFTQNRSELWNVLQGSKPKVGTFSQTGSVTGGADGSLSADRLLLYQDDVKSILNEIGLGKSSFKISEINPIAKNDGLISGVYPMNSKVISGTDEAGNKFFELKHKFGPNQNLPFGTTPSNAKEVTVKNRFYYKEDPETGSFELFDPLGNPLQTGTTKKFAVTPPIGAKFAGKAQSAITRDPNTPFPKSYTGESFGEYITDTPPRTWGDLGFRGKVGRGLETFSTTGLNLPFRSGSKNIKELDIPVFGYSNSAFGPNTINPALETNVANDIKNATNYNYRIGRNALIGLGALGYAGYKGYDAYNNACQCDDPLSGGYLKKDKYGNCPCGDAGPSRVLNPVAIPVDEEMNQQNLNQPDSMQFLRERGIEPSSRRYYRSNEFGIENPNQSGVIGDEFKKGGSFKKKFIKKLTSMFEEGGDASEMNVDKAKRNDSLTNEIEGRKSMFKSALKNNSNKAISEEIYKHAQYNPQIMNLLMQDGYKENLAEDQLQMPAAQFGGYSEIGGFVDMHAENPLTRFIYGGDEAEYYEPYDLPMAQEGINTEDPSEVIEVLGKAFNTSSKGVSQKCGPGTVWNEQYQVCIPLAQINYNPRVVRGRTGFTNTYLPWNPIMGNAGSWAKQMSLPYNLATKQAYMGQLPSAPAARYVTKKGMFGQPKKWIDIYQTSGQPGMINPMDLEALVKGTKTKSDRSDRDRNRSEREERVSKTERIDQELLKDEWNKKNWDRLSDRDKRIARRTFAFDNPEFRRFFDKVVFKQGQPGQGNYYESNKTKSVKDKKQYGGGYNPFGMGNDNRTDYEFEKGMFGTNGPANTLTQNNPFGYITSTGTGSYADTKTTGHTLGMEGQEVIPQYDQQAASQPSYVGVESKMKNMWNVDPEAGVNVFNAAARGVMGMIDRAQNSKRNRNMMLDTVDPMNLYASANEQDRGDWTDFGSKSGMFRYDQEGSDRNSRATFGNFATGRYGGYMQSGGSYAPYFEEDEEVYMTPEELDQFLASGGQVEYL